MVLVENYAGHHQNWAKCFDDPKRSDVVFEAKDGQTFHCEKFVLEVASPYFKNLFSRCEKFVAAKDVDPAALKWILRSCYTADGDLNDDNVVSVLLAAKLFEMDWVEKACMKYLKEDKAGPVATFEYSKENEKWQEWKVPESGWYHIVAMGAKAADARPDSRLYKSKGGEGAVIAGSFEFDAGDIVQILTGGKSRLWVSTKYPNYFTGGGGGTFVALGKKELTLLLVAGGGGSINDRSSGTDASLSEDGIGADAKCMGGKNGGNGGNNGQHKGGLGWKAGPVALARPKGSALDNTGGFGGGGDICGGGAGYSGGSAGYQYSGGGGGGSYAAPEAENSWKKLGNYSHGKVFIWKGKKVPSEESFFKNHVGDTGEGSQNDEEPIHCWEVLD